MIQCLLDGSRSGCSPRVLTLFSKVWRGGSAPSEAPTLRANYSKQKERCWGSSWTSYHSDVMGEAVKGRPGGPLHPRGGANVTDCRLLSGGDEECCRLVLHPASWSQIHVFNILCWGFIPLLLHSYIRANTVHLPAFLLDIYVSKFTWSPAGGHRKRNSLFVTIGAATQAWLLLGVY